jgi:hypothetical protein
MLTGLSLLFALANVFVDVIPVTEHFQPLYRLPPTVVTPLASVTSLFVLLATYARRGAVAAARGRDRARRSATVSFATGLAALASISSAPCWLGRTCMATPGTPRSGATANSSPATLPSPACTRGSSRFTRTFLLLVSDAGILPTARPKTPRNPGRTQLPDTAKSRIYCNTGLSRRLCNTRLEQPSA